MLIFAVRVDRRRSIKPARDEDGNLLFEGSPCFEHGRRAFEKDPRRFQIRRAFELLLAFAIVAESRRL